MYTSSILLTATTLLATTVSAAPTSFFENLGSSIESIIAKAQKASCSSACGFQQQKAVQPKNSLTPPTGDVKWIALGTGTQNYTCGSDSTAAPKAIGAVANLWDLTKWFSNNIAQQNAETVYKMVPCASNAAYDSNFGLPQLGKHYFTAAGVPTFDLYNVGALLSSAKKGAVAAPSDACHGRDSAAAVPWLYLTEDGSGSSKNVKSVYRLETVGGSAPATCAGLEGQSFTHDYAAEYWFY